MPACGHGGNGVTPEFTLGGLLPCRKREASIGLAAPSGCVMDERDGQRERERGAALAFALFAGYTGVAGDVAV